MTTTYTATNPRTVYASDIRAHVTRYDVLAVEGPCDWNAGSITEYPDGVFFADCDRGFAQCESMEVALDCFR